MFSNARHVVFAGNPVFINHENDRTSALAAESLDEGIRILLQNVAKGAMHNSGERFDAPTCHPETRIALQDDVLGWADEPPGGQLVTWMHGPAGAGKSAIAQTVCQKLRAKGQLTASFFFSRSSASKGRGDETALIATLAYQLSLSTPTTKPYIAKAVRENPLIFDLSLYDQVAALIVSPLTLVYEEDQSPKRPMVIVVDGLDECRKDENAQSRVVRALVAGVSNIPHRSHKLFITSRPEHHIAAIFRGYGPELLRKTELNDKWNPDEDIRTFLSASFADIRRSHHYFQSHPADKTWPSREDINTLVKRSSGQFIYASVVIKYIKSEDYYDPAARLEVILQLKNNDDRPYAELDALYEYIFSQIRDVEKVLAVLSLQHMFQVTEMGWDRPTPFGQFLSDFTGTRIEEIKYWLRPLISLLVWEEDSIRYMHASLLDFLLDQSRSDNFCIYTTSITTRFVRRALDMLEDEHTLTNHHLMSILPRIPCHYTQKLSPQHKIHIYSMISDFNIVESVLSRMAGLRVVTPKRVFRAIGSYLEWILTESKSDNPLECRKALVDSLSQIQTWMMERLAYKSFNSLDNSNQVDSDLWPFFTPLQPIHLLMPPDSEDLRRQMTDIVTAALEICGLTTASDARDKDVELSDQTVLFLSLVPHIPRWHASTNLLGRYAITGERYTVALLHISQYLLRLPKDQLALVLDCTDRSNLSAAQLLAWDTFRPICNCALRSIEAYFFILFLYSVIMNYGESSMASYAKLYLTLMRKQFPFLCDPASPEFIEAQAHAEETWIKTKRDLDDPILSIRVEHFPDLD